MVTRADIVAEALEWVGTKWQHQAAMKGVACDCAGFTLGVGINAGALEVDFSDPAVQRFANYTRQPNQREMLAALNMFLEWVPKKFATTGDVIYRRYNNNPQHLAILTGPIRAFETTRVVHALAWPSRKVVVHSVNEEWFFEAYRTFRYPNLEDV